MFLFTGAGKTSEATALAKPPVDTWEEATTIPEQPTAVLLKHDDAVNTMDIDAMEAGGQDEETEEKDLAAATALLDMQDSDEPPKTDKKDIKGGTQSNDNTTEDCQLASDKSPDKTLNKDNIADGAGVQVHPPQGSSASGDTRYQAICTFRERRRLPPVC